jgi:hypothetical protein
MEKGKKEVTKFLNSNNAITYKHNGEH